MSMYDHFMAEGIGKHNDSIQTDEERMLHWLDIDRQEFSQMSNSERGNSIFQWRKFGKKEYKKMCG